ncbi:hypothetical protein FRC03_010858 [Tulasnella sp. 419]|nr:hypothetical protein FRC03_010858 [Tulasnella sp. 419]
MGQIPDDVTNDESRIAFLNTLLRVWKRFSRGLELLPRLLSYLERVRGQAQELIGIKETGLKLFISRVLRAQSLASDIDASLQYQAAALAKGAATDEEPLKSCLDMLLYLEQSVTEADIFRNMFLLPYRKGSANDYPGIDQYLKGNSYEELQLQAVRISLNDKESLLVKGLPPPVTLLLQKVFSIPTQVTYSVEDEKGPSVKEGKELSRPTSAIDLSDKPPQPTTIETPASSPNSAKPDMSTSSRSVEDSWVLFIRCGSGPSGRYRKQATTPKGYGGFSDIWVCDIVFEDHSTMTAATKELRAGSIATHSQGSESIVQRILARLQREIYVWSSLNHPHIVPLIGYQFHPSTCLLSPWYDYGHVMSYLQRHPNADRIKLIKQVAEGVLYLHTRDNPVVHGDLKPDNILITDSGDAVISDFGLSQVIADVSPQYNSASLRSGNPRWLAPELYSDEEVGRSTATDVYALGSVALEIMTGVLPYRKLSDINVPVALAQGLPPVRDRAEYPELPSDDPLWPILFDCWRLEASERPTMQDLHSRIQAIY